ncbi:HlyD family type I secretion periplasmic adaptor subunit [Luteimonas sp. Y-2-2-4F]|nr:HlyD family type I secretion periplasmic adaptor subunit [Luteimonas sp. Y-2-2-4F]MCD9030774.1 HlyD family type I secretion periplasmic adaptor subunit [Luteimonas sp. Y-2-2-4F]
MNRSGPQDAMSRAGRRPGRARGAPIAPSPPGGAPTLAALAAEEASQAPRGSPARLGWWLLALGFGGFLAWATFAPLDNGVSAPGTVVVAGHRQAVEHVGGGIVAALPVGEGDRVEAGQVLVRLDPTRARAEAQALRARLAAVQAREARLGAERDGLDRIELPAPLRGSDDPDIRATVELQAQLFASRRSALEQELGSLRQNLAGQRELVAGIESALAHKREQSRALGEQLGNLRQLASEGYVARNRLLETERLHASLLADISRDLGSLGQARRQIAELGLQIAQRRDAHQQEVRGELADARLEGQSLANQLDAAEFELARTEIRAPAAGIVVGLSVHTVGGVVAPGGRLMEIVPEDQPLIVEGRLPVSSVDKVHGGLPVELLFTAFEQSRTPRLEGTVELVSADRLEDERSGEPYYRVRVSVAPEQLQRLRLGSQPLRAGMPVSVFVRTGERSLMSYLFKPLFDRLGTAWGDE